MTSHLSPRRMQPVLSRRQVMIGAAGLSFALALGASRRRGGSLRRGAGKALSPWVSIAGGRDDLDHVAGDRDGAGLDDLPTARAGRGA